MGKIKAFVIKETILTIAWILAIISMFFVAPSKDYLGYIDLRTLGILGSLMIIVEGLKENQVFDVIGHRLLMKTRTVLQLSATLVFLCFFFSMFITNDVALITFAPLALYILELCKREDLLIPVLALQTIAANLGSMFTPIGNPQNIYLFGISGMNALDFLELTVPFTAITFVLLCINLFLFKSKGDVLDETPDVEVELGHKRHIRIYIGLFAIAILSVCRFIPWWGLALITVAIVFIMDKKVLLQVDYALLFTFVGFFIFTGNLGSLHAVSGTLESFVEGNEILYGVGLSQIISNVPAALLLSEFTGNIPQLILGVNFGGLGTLIASMASLITFKTLAHNRNSMKGRYFIFFTVINIIYLALLLLLYYLIPWSV